jgi:CHC2 zinc finger/DnaB-like helicase C terminal domain/Toprim-like
VTEDLRPIKSDASVLRLYSEYVKLEKKGKEWAGKCPFHAEKTGSFTVSRAASGEWLYNCFGGCGGGDIFSFVQKLDNITFREAVDKVKEFVGEPEQLTRAERIFTPIQVPEKTYKTFTIEQYAKLEKSLEQSREAKDWLLKERGIGHETAQRLHLGFRQDLKEIAGPTDTANKGWISIPCIDNGVVESIEYRSIAEKTFRRQPGMATKLFNIESVDPFTPVWLTEGKFDAAVLEQVGFCAVSLPTAGFVLTPEMRDQLLSAEYVVLAGDSDGGAGTQAMDRLQVDFGDRSVRIQWPDGCKDANEVFLRVCKADAVAFKTLCADILNTAKSQPMRGVYSLVDVLRKPSKGTTEENPNRFHWCWKSVDKMANFLPGDVALVTATDTGMGKSQWVLQATVDAARKGEVVLNYQGEMGPEAVANIVAANILGRDRNSLVSEDYAEAAKILGGIRYYIGADPNLSTVTPVLDLIEEAIIKFGITTLVIDHIHYICRNSQNEVQEQANAMQRICSIARKYGLKVIVVAQPRKADQKNEGKERQLNAVKGSEALVSDASIVYFIHRNVVKNIDPANPPMDDREPITEIRNKKARSKGTGSAYARLFFHGSIASFTEIAEDAPEPAATEEFSLTN